MGLKNNFITQTRDAIMLAELHRLHGLHTIRRADGNGDAGSRASGRKTVGLADAALAVFREALRLLPDIKAAIVVKRHGDERLLECGLHSMAV